MTDGYGVRRQTDDYLQLQTQIEELTAQILELKKSVADDLVTTQVLIRTNNLLLSRFILALEKTRKKMGLPEREIAFKFELLEEEYKELVAEFGQDEVDKAMYRLDRLLLTNRQQCPRNIKKYLHRRLKKSQNNRSIKKERA